ncbi:MAG: hypothetical protein ACOC9A_02740 [Candidatus Bipolaricaulota bacterium]
MVLTLVIGLIFTFTLIGLSAEEDETNLEQVESLGYGIISQAVEGLVEADANQEEKVKALEGIFDGVKEHLNNQGNLPEGTVDKVGKGFDSLTSLYEAGMLDSDQYSEQASELVENTGRKDPEGKVSASEMENSAIGQEISEIAKNSDPEDIGDEVRDRVMKMVENKKQQRVQEEEGKGEEIEKGEDGKEGEDKDGSDGDYQTMETAAEETNNGNGNGAGNSNGASNSREAAGNGNSAAKSENGNETGNVDTEETTVKQDESPSSASGDTGPPSNSGQQENEVSDEREKPGGSGPGKSNAPEEEEDGNRGQGKSNGKGGK